MPGRGRSYLDRMLGRNEGSESRDFTDGRRYGEDQRFFDEEYIKNDPQIVRKTEYLDRPERNHLDRGHRNQSSRNVPRTEQETRFRRENSRHDYNVDAPVDVGQRGGFFGKGPKGYKRSDDRIKEEVCEALYRNYRVDASDIEVEVKEGIVTMSGSVDSRATKRSAEECVEHLSGVIDVHNRIRIADNANVSDREKRSLS